jgi:Flp pilus assembly protein TadG
MTTIRRTRHSTEKRRGQGLVEFALVMPILMLVLFGIIDTGWIVFSFSQLYNGMRESVRYGSVVGFPATGQPAQYLDCDGIRKLAIAQASFTGVKATDITVEYDDGRTNTGTTHSRVGTCPAGGAFTQDSTYIPQGGSTASPRNVQNGDRIIVTVDVNLHFLTPFIRAFAPSGIQVSFKTDRSVFPGGL